MKRRMLRKMWQNNDERRFDATNSKYMFRNKRQGTSVWKALTSISAWILTVKEMMKRELANSFRRVPPRLATRGRRSSSASIAGWQAPPCLPIETAVENHHQQLDWAQQRCRPTVVQWRVDNGKQALPDGRLPSPGLVTNGGHGVTELRGRTHVRSI